MIWPFKKRKPKNIYKVTYIPGADIDREKGTAVCYLCNMQEAYVEAESAFEAQKVFADFGATHIVLYPHVYIDRIEEVVHRSSN